MQPTLTDYTIHSVSTGSRVWQNHTLTSSALQQSNQLHKNRNRAKLWQQGKTGMLHQNYQMDSFMCDFYNSVREIYQQV